MSGIIAGIACAALAAAAQDDGAANSPLSGLRPAAGFGGTVAPRPKGEGPIELTVEACVREVLIRNLTLKMAELDQASRVAGIEQALGAFDPELYARAVGSDNEQPTASSFAAPRNHSVDGAAGLRGLLHSGMAYDLGYSASYNRQSPSNPFFGFNPTVASALALNVTQPLLRGFGTTVTEAPVEQARLFVAQGGLDLYAQVQETAFQAVAAYWNLVRARRERDTAQSALEVAEELVGNNQKRLDAGVMTRLDVLTARAEAARRREALIRAQNSVGRSEDIVKSLLSPGTDPVDWRREIVPATEAALDAEPLPTEEEAIEGAFGMRADLRALEVAVDSADLALEVAANGRMPQLDLNGSYGFAGLSGKQAGGASKNNPDLVAESFSQVRDGDFDQWSVGFDFSQPIGNRTAAAGQRRAELDKERAVMAVLERRMSIVQELRGAIRDVADAQAAFEAAQQARVLAEEQYQAELVRLENEHSTTFQVREAQRDLFEAQDSETAAITQYEVLRAAYLRFRGDLAQRHGVRWEPAFPPEGAIRE